MASTVVRGATYPRRIPSRRLVCSVRRNRGSARTRAIACARSESVPTGCRPAGWCTSTATRRCSCSGSRARSGTPAWRPNPRAARAGRRRSAQAGPPASAVESTAAAPAANHPRGAASPPRPRANCRPPAVIGGEAAPGGGLRDRWKYRETYSSARRVTCLAGSTGGGEGGPAGVQAASRSASTAERPARAGVTWAGPRASAAPRRR